MKKYVYIQKYANGVDWISEEKEYLKNEILRLQDNIKERSIRKHDLMTINGRLGLDDHVELNRDYGDKKLNQAYIHIYETRLNCLKRGLFKTQEDYFTTMLI